MASGSKDQFSGTGVVFSHDPATGQRGLCGTVTDSSLTQIEADKTGLTVLSATQLHDLRDLVTTAEVALRDMVRLEFSITNGSLTVLQSLAADRSGVAALRVAVELAKHPEILLSHEEAVLLVSASHLEEVLHPQFSDSAIRQGQVLARGMGASPGAAAGRAYFSASAAMDAYDRGEDVILVMEETSPQDVPAMAIAEGILTTKGGLSSHAAIVARGSGTPAVCGAGSLGLGEDYFEAMLETGLVRVAAGDVISIDGDSGLVLTGLVHATKQDGSADMDVILSWADEIRGDKLGVRANADNAVDAAQAREFGAEGIGLCRTEHQFLGARLSLIQAVILATNAVEELLALEHLGNVQRPDFLGLLQAMDGLPVTVRLLDPPLHEFLPSATDLLVKQAKVGLTDPEERLLAAAQRWHEHNPMLGARGVRLGILRPQLFRTQMRSLMQAAHQHQNDGGQPMLEIMIPLIVNRQELDLVRGWLEEELDQAGCQAVDRLDVQIGSMIETPRAALCASNIAGGADFFSFGTNDLTQMTFGFSRDDVETRIMGEYLDRALLAANPFETLDIEGVGQLVASAVIDARSANPGIKLGVCGEHAADPASIGFFWKVGVDYVSCSPYRVPIARLVAAQAIVQTEKMIKTNKANQSNKP